MFGKSKQERLSYGVVGLGRFGSALAKELAAAGADLLVIDQNEEKVREMRELTDNALVVHGLDKRPWRKPASRTVMLRLSASASIWNPPS